MPLAAEVATDFMTKTLLKNFQFNPTTRLLQEVSVDKVEKQICLLEANDHLTGANNSLALVERFSKQKIGFKILRGLLSDYLDEMRLSSFDFTIESANEKRFPQFFSDLQELSFKMTKDFGLVKEGEFVFDYNFKLQELYQLISSETLRLKAGYINFPDSICQVTSSKNLQCLCKSSEVYHRIDISPSFKDGKILAFDNFIFKNSEYKSDALKSCFYQLKNDYFLLNEECCLALQKSSEEAINFCPNLSVGNFSPVKLSKGLIIVDNRFKQILTQCDSSTTQIDKSSDIIRMSNCDASIIGDNYLKYSIKQGGNFNNDYLQNSKLELESVWTMKDLLLYLACGFLCLILIVLLILLICCFQRRNGFKCCVFASSMPDQENAMNLGNFQMAEMQTLRPVVTMQRPRNVRSIK